MSQAAVRPGKCTSHFPERRKIVMSIARPAEIGTTLRVMCMRKNPVNGFIETPGVAVTIYVTTL